MADQPADLRSRLKALVEEWRKDTEYVLEKPAEYAPRDVFECRSIKRCADQLAALLAESEPETRPPDLKAAAPGEVWTGHISRGDEPEPPKPKLGHPYENHHEDQGVDCTLAGRCHHVTGQHKCGQPRSAHEPAPPEPKP